MSRSSHTMREVRALSRLAAPILATNVCWMMVGVVDVVMLSRWSSEAVAAALLAGVWVHLTQVAGMGLVMGMDPLVTQGHGARDREAMGRALQRGLLVALLASIPVVGLRFFTGELLAGTRAFAAWIAGPEALSNAAGLDLENAAALDGPAEIYALTQSFATPFFLAYIALRQYLQGRGILRPALLVAVAANVVNVGTNWLMIYGLEWGVAGAGLATGITRVFMFSALLWVLLRRRLLRGAWVPWDRESFAWSGLRRVLAFGIPVCLHFALEVGAFGATTLLSGMLGVTATVAHGVAINLASLSFMVPLGIGLAATTRVGNLVGERRFEEAQESASIALWLGGLTMAALGVVLYTGRWLFPTFYVPEDAAAIALAAAVLPIAAAFQVFDGLQVVGSGILRGMGRTVPPAVFNFFAWWVIALPLAAWLVLRRGGGLEHVWWALVLGLAVVAILAVLWVRSRGPATLARST
ncbi:MAG: MATE family efflux transporter [Planctomycetota bacterium]